MIVWNPEKNRILYKEDMDGNRVYPYGEDKPKADKEPAEDKKPRATRKKAAEVE